MSKYQVELVWNREFDFIQYGRPHEDLDQAIACARAIQDGGDGERVKKTRIVDEDGEVVWAHGRLIPIPASNPFKVGDRVALRPDVLQRHARSVPAHVGYNTEEFKWRDILLSLCNSVGTVTHLFPRSKHTNVRFDAPANPQLGLKAYSGTIGIDWTELVTEICHLESFELVDEII